MIVKNIYTSEQHGLLYVEMNQWLLLNLYK